MKDWDFIIVGGGSAGAVLAARLSEPADCRVLLLEAGGSDWYPGLHVPGLVEQGILSRRWNWHYQGEPDPSLGGRRLVWAGGRVLGGSSSINGMVYGRGLPADYAAWVAAGNAGWGWDDMLPAFRKAEDWRGPASPARGQGGPVSVREFTETDPACRAVMEAFIAHGVPRVPDYCAGISEGIGLTQATQKGGWRHSAARAYLRPARSRENLRVVTGARAERLLLERGRCIGVAYRRRGGAHLAYAAREVIVAAGAIGTPKLLLLSGIGAAEALQPHGIAVAHELPAVGKHLNEHVNIKLCGFVDTPSYNTQRRGLAALRHGLRFLAAGQGPASSPANHVQAFIKTRPGLAGADAQVQLMAFGFGSAAEMQYNGMTAVVSICRPLARGSITLRSADPADAPKLAISLLEHDEDVAVLQRACALTRAMMCQAGVRLYAPADDPGTQAGWRGFFTQSAALNWHPASSCRMAPDSARGVVDAQLAVHGLRGLRIADASVMPSVTSGNTNAPVLAIAERAAEFAGGRV